MSGKDAAWPVYFSSVQYWNLSDKLPETRLDHDKSAMTAAMQRIEDWLEKLGMPEYARRFTDNDIDTSVLRHLSDRDLKELGV